MAFWKLYYHLVWGTKNKQPLITPKTEPRLYSFLVTRAAEMGLFVYQVNGWLDHVHLILAIPPKHAVSAVVKILKGSSSHYMNAHGLSDEYFAWQRGYGALSLGEKQRPFAEAYVINQKQHHEQQTTNSWLERLADYDEGPVELTKTSGLLREPSVIYEVGDDFPF